MDDPRLDDREMKLLTDVLTGGRRDDDPEVIASSERSADFRASLEELRELQHQLEVDGRSERDAVDAALRGGGVESDSLVAETIHRLAEQDAPAMMGAGSRRARWALVGAVAAAGLLLILAVGKLTDPGRFDDDFIQLGDHRLQLNAPVASEVLPGGLTLTWSCDLAGATYTVEIFDGADPIGQPLLDSDELFVGRFELDRESVAGLPRSARWRVIARLPGRMVMTEGKLFE